MSQESALILALQWQLEQEHERYAALSEKFSSLCERYDNLEAVAAYTEFFDGGSAKECNHCKTWFNSEKEPTYFNCDCCDENFCDACTHIAKTMCLRCKRGEQDSGIPPDDDLCYSCGCDCPF